MSSKAIMKFVEEENCFLEPLPGQKSGFGDNNGYSHLGIGTGRRWTE